MATTLAFAAARNLEQRCRLLRSLHIPGSPLVLPNAWDVASARAVVAAGFPVVASASADVAADELAGGHPQLVPELTPALTRAQAGAEVSGAGRVALRAAAGRA